MNNRIAKEVKEIENLGNSVIRPDIEFDKREDPWDQIRKGQFRV